MLCTWVLNLNSIQVCFSIRDTFIHFTISRIHCLDLVWTNVSIAYHILYDQTIWRCVFPNISTSTLRLFILVIASILLCFFFLIFIFLPHNVHFIKYKYLLWFTWLMNHVVVKMKRDTFICMLSYNIIDRLRVEKINIYTMMIHLKIW